MGELELIHQEAISGFVTLTEPVPGWRLDKGDLGEETLLRPGRYGRLDRSLICDPKTGISFEVYVIAPASFSDFHEGVPSQYVVRTSDAD